MFMLLNNFGDKLKPLGKNLLFFWVFFYIQYAREKKFIYKSILTCRSAISANALYLEAEAREGSDRLAKNIPGGPEIIGAVYIHPSAHVDPTAKVRMHGFYQLNCYWHDYIDWS